jgi:hypothetical protein
MLRFLILLGGCIDYFTKSFHNFEQKFGQLFCVCALFGANFSTPTLIQQELAGRKHFQAN